MSQHQNVHIHVLLQKLKNTQCVKTACDPAPCPHREHSVTQRKPVCLEKLIS